MQVFITYKSHLTGMRPGRLSAWQIDVIPIKRSKAGLSLPAFALYLQPFGKDKEKEKVTPVSTLSKGTTHIKHHSIR